MFSFSSNTRTSVFNPPRYQPRTSSPGPNQPRLDQWMAGRPAPPPSRGPMDQFLTAAPAAGPHPPLPLPPSASAQVTGFPVVEGPSPRDRCFICKELWSYLRSAFFANFHPHSNAPDRNQSNPPPNVPAPLSVVKNPRKLS